MSLSRDCDLKIQTSRGIKSRSTPLSNRVVKLSLYNLIGICVREFGTNLNCDSTAYTVSFTCIKANREPAKYQKYHIFTSY